MTAYQTSVRPSFAGRPIAPDVDDARARDLALPRDARVRAQQQVRAARAHSQLELVVVERLPQEVVDGQRRAVDHVDVDAADLDAQLAGQLAHPRRELGRRVRPRVVVHELREVVVALVGVAAAAVLVAAARSRCRSCRRSS